MTSLHGCFRVWLNFGCDLELCWRPPGSRVPAVLLCVCPTGVACGHRDESEEVCQEAGGGGSWTAPHPRPGVLISLREEWRDVRTRSQLGGRSHKRLGQSSASSTFASFVPLGRGVHVWGVQSGWEPPQHREEVRPGSWVAGHESTRMERSSLAGEQQGRKFPERGCKLGKMGFCLEGWVWGTCGAYVRIQETPLSPVPPRPALVSFCFLCKEQVAKHSDPPGQYSLPRTVPPGDAG